MLSTIKLKSTERSEQEDLLDLLDEIEVIAFRQEQGSEMPARNSRYSSFSKLACDYCRDCHCATYS